MLSNKTLLELIRLADKLTHAEVNRIIAVFNFPKLAPAGNNTITSKTTEIFNDLRYNHLKAGPFTDDVQLDLLQYLIDDYFEKNPRLEKGLIDYAAFDQVIDFNNAFGIIHKGLINSLKRDGYFIEGKTIKKLLPQEIEEAKIESELFSALTKFTFTISKGHLTQAISNHSQGNWAGANSQFRTFIESLLTEISNYLLPANKSTTAAQAINILTETVNPPFLRKDLNEVPKDKDSDSLVFGLWVRLHPDGSHPGLSDEDDCSFRYHISIVFANYLLRRVEERKSLAIITKII
jgi:hypothetical protein